MHYVRSADCGGLSLFDRIKAGDSVCFFVFRAVWKSGIHIIAFCGLCLARGAAGLILKNSLFEINHCDKFDDYNYNAYF